MATVRVRARDIGVKAAGYLYLRLGVTIATAFRVRVRREWANVPECLRTVTLA